MNSKRRWVRAGLLSLGLIFVGCAGSQPAEGAGKCQSGCDLDFMTCLEAMECTAQNGDRIPCDEACGQEKMACKKRCD